MNYNLSTPDANTWYYYHYNAHGDVVAVTDANGNVFREYVYDPYGNIISVKDGSGSNVDVKTDTTFNHAYTYAGYRFDRETGLYYLNARYYEAGIGRFLTKDSVFTPNQYVYAAGDPVNYVDPSGLWFETVADILSIAWSGSELWNNPSWSNAGFLAWDIGAALLPFLPGSYVGKAAKAIAKTDDVIDVAKSSSKTVSKGASKTPTGRLPCKTIDPSSRQEVGRFVVDPKGNAMIEPVGGSTIPAGRGGVNTHTLYPNGSNYQRLNPLGHGNNPTAHGHGHLMGTGPGMKGQGSSIDVFGNNVPWDSAGAHWSIFK